MFHYSFDCIDAGKPDVVRWKKRKLCFIRCNFSARSFVLRGIDLSNGRLLPKADMLHSIGTQRRPKAELDSSVGLVQIEPKTA